MPPLSDPPTTGQFLVYQAEIRNIYVEGELLPEVARN